MVVLCLPKLLCDEWDLLVCPRRHNCLRTSQLALKVQVAAIRSLGFRKLAWRCRHSLTALRDWFSTYLLDWKWCSQIYWSLVQKRNSSAWFKHSGGLRCLKRGYKSRERRWSDQSQQVQKRLQYTIFWTIHGCWKHKFRTWLWWVFRTAWC